MHDASSRSHSILRLRLHTPAPEGKRRGVEATVSLVDLAGSTHAPPSLLLDVAFCADSSAIGTLDSLDVHDRTYLERLVFVAMCQASARRRRSRTTPRRGWRAPRSTRVSSRSRNVRTLHSTGTGLRLLFSNCVGGCTRRYSGAGLGGEPHAVPAVGADAGSAGGPGGGALQDGHAGHPLSGAKVG